MREEGKERVGRGKKMDEVGWEGKGRCWKGWDNRRLEVNGWHDKVRKCKGKNGTGRVVEGREEMGVEDMGWYGK